MKITAKKCASFALMVLTALVMLSGTMSGTVSAAYASTYQTIADLNGKKIGVQTGCLYETHIAENPDAENQRH